MWAEVAQNRQKFRIFWQKFAPKGRIPLSDFFYKIRRGEGIPDPHPRAKFHHRGFRNAGLKSTKIIILVKSAPNEPMPLSDFLPNFAQGRES